MPSTTSAPRWTSRGYHCVAVDCPASINPTWLFCWRHWHMVPAHLKAAIHKHYQAKRRREFAAAVDLAIAAVATAEAA